MKSIILVALALVAVTFAGPVDDEPVQIIRSQFNQQPEGSYEFSFEAANGILRSETGELKEVIGEDKKPQNVVVVRGSYSYPGLNGLPRLTINYFADETGYHAEGDSIPKPSRR